MSRVVDKLSTQQLHRLLRANARWRDVALVRIACVVADQEDLVSESSMADALDDDAWCESTCEAIRDHADGCGRGTWRYAVRVVRESDERVLGSTWARVVVRAVDDEEGAGLDGSVSSYVQQMQRTLDQQQKINIETQRLLMATYEAQGKLLQGVFERQSRLEAERADLVAASLADAAERAAQPSEDMFADLLKLVAPAIGEKLAERFMPMLMGAGDAQTGAESQPKSDVDSEAAE